MHTTTTFANFWPPALKRALAALVLACAALQSALAQAQAQPSFTVSPEQVQQVVAQRFPRQYAVAGLLHLDVQAPHLRLLPAQNRISADMAVQASGPALQRRQPGAFDVDFALRYEASDHTLRAYQLRFQNLRFANLPPQVSSWLNVYGPALATQSLQEVVVHQLSSQDLAMADNLGMQPDSITVTDRGLVIGLVLKPL